MSNILQGKVTIRGARPLLWHHFGPDAIPLEKRERSGVAGHDPEEWRRTVLVTRDGQLYLHSTYVFGTLIGGAKYVTKGRGSIQTVVAATLQVLDNRVLINRYFPGYPNGTVFDVTTAPPPSQDEEEPVYLDIRSVVNPQTKGRNVRYRIAASPGWECEFTLQWDKTIVDRNQMASCVLNAGQLVGLGNGRKIGMGRFEVLSMDIFDA